MDNRKQLSDRQVLMNLTGISDKIQLAVSQDMDCTVH